MVLLGDGFAQWHENFLVSHTVSMVSNCAAGEDGLIDKNYSVSHLERLEELRSRLLEPLLFLCKAQARSI